MIERGNHVIEQEQPRLAWPRQQSELRRDVSYSVIDAVVQSLANQHQRRDTIFPRDEHRAPLDAISLFDSLFPELPQPASALQYRQDDIERPMKLAFDGDEVEKKLLTFGIDGAYIADLGEIGLSLAVLERRPSP